MAQYRARQSTRDRARHVFGKCVLIAQYRDRIPLVAKESMPCGVAVRRTGMERQSIAADLFQEPSEPVALCGAVVTVVRPQRRDRTPPASRQLFAFLPACPSGGALGDYQQAAD